MQEGHTPRGQPLLERHHAGHVVHRRQALLEHQQLGHAERFVLGRQHRGQVGGGDLPVAQGQAHHVAHRGLRQADHVAQQRLQRLAATRHVAPRLATQAAHLGGEQLLHALQRHRLHLEAAAEGRELVRQIEVVAHQHQLAAVFFALERELFHRAGDHRVAQVGVHVEQQHDGRRIQALDLRQCLRQLLGVAGRVATVVFFPEIEQAQFQAMGHPQPAADRPAPDLAVGALGHFGKQRQHARLFMRFDHQHRRAGGQQVEQGLGLGGCGHVGVGWGWVLR